MEESHAPPTAAELGISDTEYERILLDVRRRHGLGEPVAAQPSRQRVSMRWPIALLALIVGIALVPRLAGADGDGEPAYAFMDVNQDAPVAYSSCRLVQVAIYPAGGPPDAERLVREAVATMRAATGLDIVVAGVFGGHAPNWNFEAVPVAPDDPISVSWQDGDAIAELTDHTAGLGGSRIITSPTGIPYRVSGTIALSRDYYALLAERGDHSEALAVLLHEFGHVFGLDHVDSSNELMHANNSDRNTLGPGDREGLRLLGRGPCV